MTHDEVEILYVEDNSADVELTLVALRRNRVANRVHVARDGAEALDFLFCNGPFAGRAFHAPKLVLLDMKLPKVDGIEVLHAIRKDQRTSMIPVVVLTSSNEQKDMLESYRLHVNSYIQKPVDFDTFQQVVQQLGLYWLVVNQTPLSRVRPATRPVETEPHPWLPVNKPRHHAVIRIRLQRMSRWLLVAAMTSLSWAGRAEAGQDGNVPLKQLSLAELGNVQVTTASKEPEEVWKTPAAIYVITQEDIRRSGATNLPDILRLAPGVEVGQIDSDHWSVSIRGFGAELSNKLLVLIDGRSVYTPLYAGVYWQAQATPLVDIERIEVIRGPGGTIWGANAVDGIINIITKSSKDTHGAMLSAGGGNVDQGTGVARYGAANSHGFNYRAYAMGFTIGPEFHSDGANFDDWRMGQAGFRTDSDQESTGHLHAARRHLPRACRRIEPPTAMYSPPFQVTVDGNANLSGGNLLARWKRVQSERSDFQVQAYFDRTSHFEPGYYGETRNTVDIDMLDHLTLPGRQNFLWGLGRPREPRQFCPTRLHPRLSAPPPDGPDLQRVCAGHNSFLE